MSAPLTPHEHTLAAIDRLKERSRRRELEENSTRREDRIRRLHGIVSGIYSDEHHIWKHRSEIEHPHHCFCDDPQRKRDHLESERRSLASAENDIRRKLTELRHYGIDAKDGDDAHAKLAAFESAYLSAPGVSADVATLNGIEKLIKENPDMDSGVKTMLDGMRMSILTGGKP
jgi:hypothetical protein